ncbi:MAG: PFL family protein [Archaeoglobi archaeon]|nr:PFL family protein [Candidatus Mnemosynella bozhongmuii]
MLFSVEEILETISMISSEHLDIRTVTLGINLRGCSSENPKEVAEKVYEKICSRAERLKEVTENISRKYGIPIVNKRVSTSPVSELVDACGSSLEIAEAMDEASRDIGIDYIGGFSALVQKGYTKGARILISSIPEALSSTERLCSSVNIATTRSGINVDAAVQMGEIIKKCCSINPVLGSRLVVFANAPPDNPFMAGAFHGTGESEAAVNVGISGPGVIRSVVERMEGAQLGEIAEEIKKAAFKITRVGELVGREVARELGVDFGIVDLSLAPTPERGDSVAEIIEKMGIEVCGAPGSTAALALLTDAVKKGGMMASSSVGGLSGAFIPVSEDSGMARAVEKGGIILEKLEAMTSVCSVGIDMVVLPEETPEEIISAIILDECAIGVMNDKTTGVRVILAGKPGEWVELGGLLGSAPVMNIRNFDVSKFIRRGGRIPAPVHSLKN